MSSRWSRPGVITTAVLMLGLLVLTACTAGSDKETDQLGETAAGPTEIAESSEENVSSQTDRTGSSVEMGEKPGNPELSLPEQSGEAVPEESTTPAVTPTPTATPMFDIIGGKTIYLSITEEEFIEIADFLRTELNLNDAALAGILANLQGESGFNPHKVGDNGSAFGICQWQGPRLNQMVQYCEENDLNPVSREGQLRFLAHDLKEVYIYAYDQIRLCEDSEKGALQATYNFCAYYEVPADPEGESKEREELTKLLIYPRLNELSEAD